MMRRANVIRATWLCIALLGAWSCNTREGMGSTQQPIRFYFTPFGASESIAENLRDMTAFFERETGYKMRIAMPTSNLDLINGLGNGSVDVAIMNSYGYLLAKKQYNAELKFSIVRDGSRVYRGMIISHIDSGVETINQLNGRSFIFTHKSSASGYLMARKLLHDANVVLGSEQFANRHDNLVEMIYKQQVPAGSGFYSPPKPDGSLRDARHLVEDRYPDVAEKVRIIEFTEPIPNGGIVVREGVSVEITEKIGAALRKYLETDRGKSFFKENYQIDAIVPGIDEDYEPLRQALTDLKIDPDQLFK